MVQITVVVVCNTSTIKALYWITFGVLPNYCLSSPYTSLYVLLYDYFKYTGLVDILWHVPKPDKVNMVDRIDYYDNL